MRAVFKKILSPSKVRKASLVSPILAYHLAGRPVWTPRRYENLIQEGYVKNVIVYRSVNLIARGAASVPWRLYKNQKELSHHPLLDILHRPNLHQGGAAFIETTIAYLLLSGNVYIEAVLGAHHQPVELHALRPDRMKVIPGKSGLPQAYEYAVNGTRRLLPVDQQAGRGGVLHIKLFNPLNDWYGMSPIEAAACSIDQHNTVSGHNLSLLQNGGRPSGALKIGDRLSQPEREELRQQLTEMYEGTGNAGRVMVLEGDFEWKEMGLSPKDLDFVEGKNLSAREIAQAYGVPPMLVGVPGDATFANYKEARYHLWEDTILPLLDTFTDELNAWLAPQFSDTLRLAYDIDGIHALAPRREDAWAKVSRASFLTINEKREAMGYEPIPGGDCFEKPGGSYETAH